MTTPNFKSIACYRWSPIRIWNWVRLAAHCLVRGHAPVMIWGDYTYQMGEISENSWVVTYTCRDCEQKEAKRLRSEQAERNRASWVRKWPESNVTVLESICLYPAVVGSVRIQAPAGTEFHRTDFMVSFEGCELVNPGTLDATGFPMTVMIPEEVICKGDGQDVIEFFPRLISDGAYRNCTAFPKPGAKVDGGRAPGSNLPKDTIIPLETAPFQ